MIFGCFFAQQPRVPNFGPAPKALVFGPGIKLPQFADPEIARPEKALLRFPFAGLIVAFGEKAFALIARDFLGSSL